jgi:hypothetical protein
MGKKIGELEGVIELQRKEISQLKAGEGESVVADEKDKLIAKLQEQVNREQFMKEKLIIEYQLKFKEEKE